MELIEKLKFNPAILEELNRKIDVLSTFEAEISEINPERGMLSELRSVATVQSVGSSTRIEGSKLSDVEINTLLSHIKTQALETRDEQEVMGYYDVLDTMHESFNDMPFSQNMIFQLHSMLLKYSTKDEYHRGSYKILSNEVVANFADGTQKTVFRTTSPHLTSTEMDKLIEWTSRNLATKEIHPVLVVGLFVYEFLSIHPFQDGNGRLSRLLTTLLLMQNGYSFIQYISFENYIEAHKEAYYQALINGQKKRYTDEELPHEWMLFFVGGLAVLTEKLRVKFEVFSPQNVYLTDRHKKIVANINRNKAVKLSDLTKYFKTVNEASLKKDLSYLVTHKQIFKSGERKATVYFPIK